ncbi:uncharacterized protein C8Q71DRAFT_555272 [Rhodofomes roseus]|uniref:Uncharacterized protein n=1 Tax=Rhodofomes roseus TaxID=34475 RepID=A0ABQ8KI37_9APHY|nr:uncharacterized protein C8Q71DRAFT_555272 [Rhodofomes roseus]KAH9837665.1 hypothetical protein C8Q71DRAFT_555272 [Rhodofomes roseus]
MYYVSTLSGRRFRRIGRSLYDWRLLLPFRGWASFEELSFKAQDLTAGSFILCFVLCSFIRASWFHPGGLLTPRTTRRSALDSSVTTSPPGAGNGHWRRGWSPRHRSPVQPPGSLGEDGHITPPPRVVSSTNSFISSSRLTDFPAAQPRSCIASCDVYKQVPTRSERCLSDHLTVHEPTDTFLRSYGSIRSPR